MPPGVDPALVRACPRHSLARLHDRHAQGHSRQLRDAGRGPEDDERAGESRQDEGRRLRHGVLRRVRRAGRAHRQRQRATQRTARSTSSPPIHRMAEQMYPQLIEIAYTPEDAERIHKSGKLVAGIGIENGWVIGKDLSLIKRYYDLGARYMTLAHTSNNDICDSSTDPKGEEWGGLSPFGRQVVAEMNRVGMMVDVSHVSKKCMMQATALSTSPVIGSHSSTTAVANVPRNMDDEMLHGDQEQQRRRADGRVQRLREGPAARFAIHSSRALNAEFFPGAAGGRGGGGARSRGAPAGAPGGVRPSPRRDRRAVSAGDGRRLRESHRSRGEGCRHRSRRHQLRLRRRRRRHRVARARARRSTSRSSW